MELALPRQANLAGECVDPQTGHAPAGASPGVNIEPGSDDDGWIVPDPVVLGDGTAVQLYKDGEALHAAYEAIAAARFLICLEVYIFANDDTGRAFTELLCRKARAGLRVYVIYDALASMGSKDLFRQLAAAGVRLGAFHPVLPWELKYGWRPWNRDHRKLLVIDNEVGGMGGLNIGGNYAGSWVVKNVNRLRRAVGSAAVRLGSAPSAGSPECDFWRDTAIALRGPGARLLQQAFARTWTYISRGGRIGRAEFMHGLDPQSGDFGILASVPTISSPLRPLLNNLMRGARHDLWMTMAYFVPDDPLVEELCRAARRGVRVRLMLPGRSDLPVVQVAARSFYEKLMCGGIEIYERQAVVLHSKTMVIDGRESLVGSTNLDYRSIEYNCELSAIIRSEPFGRHMETLFENDVRYAKRITLAEWRKRPYRDRFVQWAVSRARYLL
jgi:cardiolipin synthase